MNFNSENCNNTLDKSHTNIHKKSLVNIDIEAIDLDNKNLVRKLLYKAQHDLRMFQRNRRIKAMRLYRAKKKVKSIDSLITHIKQRNFVSEKLSEILGVSE